MENQTAFLNVALTVVEVVAFREIIMIPVTSFPHFTRHVSHTHSSYQNLYLNLHFLNRHRFMCHSFLFVCFSKSVVAITGIKALRSTLTLGC